MLNDGLGKVRVVLHDGPTDDVDEVWVAWSEVEVHSVDEGWLTLSEDPSSVDLLTLQDGAITELGLAEIPVGAYDEVRLRLSDAWVVVDGEHQPLRVPSGTTSGLKIKVDFEVGDCSETTVDLDWDVGAHLIENPQGYTLRPVVLATSEIDDGACDPCAGEIVFPDPALEAGMRDQFNIPVGPITAADIQTPGNYVFLADRGITDLTGLQCMAGGPIYLNIVGNPVTSLEPVADLYNLQVLYLRNTSVEDLSPVAGLSELRDLRIGGSAVTDISPISGLSKLSTFTAFNMNLADWSPVGDLNALLSLGVRGSNFADLNFIHPSAPLGYLFAAGSDVADLSPLASQTSLLYIEVSQTPVVDASPLWGLPNLDFVQVRSSGLTELNGLDLPVATVLDLSTTGITDLSPLIGAPALKTLNIRSLAAADYSVLTQLPDLTNLDVTGSTFDCNGAVAGDLDDAGVMITGCP